MTSMIRLWIVATVIGLWLSLLQPTQASSLQSLNLSRVMGGRSEIVTMPKATELAAAKAIFMAHSSARPAAAVDSNFSIAREPDADSFYQAVITNPLKAETWNNLGYQLVSLNHYAEALTAYNHALLIDPNYSLGLANRCAVLSLLGEYAQALVSCQLAIERDHHWGTQGAALAWDNQGDVLFNLQRYQESLQSFEQALTLNPGNLNARRNWAITQQLLEHIAEHFPSDHP